MAAFLLLATSPFGLPTASVHMDCGPVSVCGIMTLETGEGPGKHLPACSVTANSTHTTLMCP